jgi:phosphoglycolate phosphatase
VREVAGVVGFDLDMTLVDSRPGIAATLRALSAETDTAIDAAIVVGRLGPPLEDELACWFPPKEVEAACDRFRALYVDFGVSGTLLLPGARESVAAVRAAGGGVIVVTAKYEPNARGCLQHVELVVDAVEGWRVGSGKGAALVEHAATLYVGDTPNDVAGARGVGVCAVAVTTGPHSGEELIDAGADVVLASLTEFPAFYAGWWARRAVGS